MNDRDAMVRALIETKSPEALDFLLTHGREIEFFVDGEGWFLSPKSTQGAVSLWNGQEEQYFPSTTSLMENEAFLTAWARARVETIF